MAEPVIIGRETRIYALVEPSNHDCPRYIGKTTRSLLNRLRSHKQAALAGGHRPVLRWIRKRLQSGAGPAIRWIETVPADGDWQARERHWIAKAREVGHDILNLTDGGEGLAGHKFTPEHRALIAAAIRTGANFNCENCGTPFWRRRSEIAKGNARFCSRECYQASLRGVSRPVSDACKERGVAAAAAARKLQTHCKRGHPLSGSNLFTNSQGSRGCKECRRLHKANYRRRNGQVG